MREANSRANPRDWDRSVTSAEWLASAYWLGQLDLAILDCSAEPYPVVWHQGEKSRTYGYHHLSERSLVYNIALSSGICKEKPSRPK